MPEKTSIAIFTYARPDHTFRMLASLAACHRLEECHPIIFSDGPRSPDHSARVEEVRDGVRKWAPLYDAEVIERSENLGLARSIVAGVTQVCAQYGQVIVLEDDLILHPAFLDFMLRSLARYREENQVAQISGFTFPIETAETSDAFFLPLVNSWGWATWKRAWDFFSWELQPAIEELSSDIQLRTRFDLEGAFPYYALLQSSEKGTTDSWAIRWYWQTFRRDMLTLYPSQSLVWQNGFDAFATHTRGAWPGFQGPLDLFLRSAWPAKPSFPERAEADSESFARLKKHLRRVTAGVFAPSLPKRIYNRISHLYSIWRFGKIRTKAEKGR